MNLVWDGIIAVILIVFVLSAYRKGFLNTILKTVGSIAAFIVSGIYSKPVAVSIFDKYLKENIVAKLAEKIDDMGKIGTEEFAVSIKEGISQLPAGIGDYLGPQVEEYLQQHFLNFQTIGTGAFAEGFCEAVIEPFMVLLVRALVFSVSFGILMFFVNLVSSLLKGIKFIPVIGPLNAVLGGFLGIVQGILYVFVLSTVLWLILTATGGIDNVLTNEIIENTFLLKKFLSLAPWVGEIIKQYNFC